MEHLLSFSLQTAATLIGLLVGTLTALAVDRRKERRCRRIRAEIILRSLERELTANHEALLAARPAFRQTAWGASFHVSTTAWETALSNADLPAIIGFQLADTLSEHYATLVRVRYYLDLMTRLWMAPRGVDGYDGIRGGFHRAISAAMNEVIRGYDGVAARVKDGLHGEPAPVPRDRRLRLAQGQATALSPS